MAQWEQRLHVRCAIADEKHKQEMMTQCLKVIARLLGGAPENEPTDEKPVVETSSLANGVETKVKKLVDREYDDRVKELAEQSMATKRETEDIIKQMKADIAAGKPITG